jgi:hypothetical protein
MEKDELTSEFNDKLREDPINSVSLERPGLSERNTLDFIKEVGKKFIEKRVEAFPTLCEIARVQNYLKFKELEQTGNKGKFTDSVGWSNDGHFKWEYEIPQELYLFMINLVYKNFWDEDNRRVYRKFMKKICDGEDAMATLGWAKSFYACVDPTGMVLN